MVGLYQAAVNRRQHRILRLSFFGFKFISKILNLSRYFVWLLFIDYFRVDLARIKCGLNLVKFFRIKSGGKFKQAE